jgi:NAD-dependent SIR2 family protein deacetylase
MSDNWIALIPEDPRLVPDQAKIQRARDRFAEIAPDADEIEVKISETVKFFDCGGNFERVRCPACQLEIPIEWWQNRMSEDYGDGFKLAAYQTPCCGAHSTLHELVYEWPQGFGRFALDAMNPNIGELEERYKAEFEAILGTKLRVIYQHI